jgi:hypothetical protein
LLDEVLDDPDEGSVLSGPCRQGQSKGIGGHGVGVGSGMDIVQAEEARSGVQIRIDAIDPERKPPRAVTFLVSGKAGQTGFQLRDLKGRGH